MYGLDIRLGYYLQWYGGMLATLLAPDEVGNARISLGFFISATFLALIIQTVRHQLYSIEIYIILLLTFGAYISLLPILLWRLLTRCDPRKDPTRFPLVDPGSIHSDLHSVLLLAVTGFQLWFWIAKVPELDSLYCKRYGFIFAKVPLNDKALQVISIVVYFLLGVSVLVMLALRINRFIRGARDSNGSEEVDLVRRYSQQWLDHRIGTLQLLNMVQSVATATVVVVATELTIQWNDITGLNSLDSAGQLIPFVIGSGILVRVIYVFSRAGYRPPSTRRRPLRGHQLPVGVHGIMSPPLRRHWWLRDPVIEDSFSLTDE